jgi:hypothetical protein
LRESCFFFTSTAFGLDREDRQARGHAPSWRSRGAELSTELNGVRGFSSPATMCLDDAAGDRQTKANTPPVGAAALPEFVEAL